MADNGAGVEGFGNGVGIETGGDSTGGDVGATSTKENSSSLRMRKKFSARSGPPSRSPVPHGYEAKMDKGMMRTLAKQGIYNRIPNERQTDTHRVVASPVDNARHRIDKFFALHSPVHKLFELSQVVPASTIIWLNLIDPVEETSCGRIS